MKRLDLFYSLKNHPMYQTTYKKLSKTELDLCVEFIKNNRDCTYGQFNKILSVWFLDRADKPKNMTSMYTLVMASNPLPAEWRTLPSGEFKK